MENISYSHIEVISASLVREYLYRKGLRGTLDCMDVESPRTPDSISSRMELVKVLRLEKLMNRNRELERPFRTMIEVIIQHLQEKFNIPRKSKHSVKDMENVNDNECAEVYVLEEIFNLSENSRLGIIYNPDLKRYVIPLPWDTVKLRDSHRHTNIPSTFPEKNLSDLQNSNSNYKSRRNTYRNSEKHLLSEFSGRNSRIRNSKEEQRSGSEPPSPTHEPPSSSPSHKSHQRTCQELGLDFPNGQDNALKAKKNILLSSLCSSSDWKGENNTVRLGPSRNNVFECLQKSPVTSPDEQKPLSNEIFNYKRLEDTPKLEDVNDPNKKGIENVDADSKSIPEHKLISKPNIERMSGGDEVANCVPSSEISQVIESGNISVSKNITNEQTNTLKLNFEVDSLPKSEDWLSPEENECEFSSDGRKEQNTPGNMSPRDVFPDVQDMVMMDLDEEDSVPEFLDISVAHTPVSLVTAVDLKRVVLGSSMAHFTPQWLGQGFIFNTHHKLRYGFVQRKGGSCGVLATVQAFLLKILLFEQGACSCTEPLRPTRKEACSALVRALGDVLWTAGLGESAVLALCSDVSYLCNCTKYSQDGLTERLNLTSFHSREQLEAGIKNNLDQFTNMTGNGCLLLLFSAVLSRGLHRVKNDMDEYSPLIGQNGQCTLELVNLFLTGYAVSNVFDNSLQVDSCWLRGVNTRADVGFLSLFEHYNSCQVGSYLKTPRFPIWVVCSENHFSVLFSCRRELVSDWKAERRFHLYYYDGMAKQEDEIKLTVDTTGLHIKSQGEADRTPPLEHCIRTKWKDAIVDWNGYQPIL